MKLRIGSITFLLFLSSVAFPQATSRYLDKPLPQGWEEDTQIFQQVLPVDDQWWKAFQDPVLDYHERKPCALRFSFIFFHISRIPPVFLF